MIEPHLVYWIFLWLLSTLEQPSHILYAKDRFGRNADVANFQCHEQQEH